MTPKISVVTVVRNDAPGLMRTAKSLFEQLTGDYEWVIVDGESRDLSEADLDYLSSSPNVFLAQRQPKGIYDAMNFGVSISRGEWCWFVNAGDVMLGRDSLAKALELTNTHGGAVIIGSPVVYFAPNGRVISVANASIPGPSNRQRGNFHHQGALIKRIEIASAGAFRLDLKVSADGALLDKVASQGQTVAINYPLVGFFPGGASTRSIGRVIRETNEFRKGEYSLLQSLELRLKNLLLRGLLSSTRVWGLRIIVDSVCAVRERRLTSASVDPGDIRRKMLETGSIQDFFSEVVVPHRLGFFN